VQLTAVHSTSDVRQLDADDVIGRLLCRAAPAQHSRGEMYIGHGRLCLCGCLSLAAFPHYCTDPDVT